ncbi:MAG TPA: hypothetical protein VLA21_09725 [Candidatus Limnocylindria bacterium]|nr:hypothetical protein [Candidatus Limnocylindria bacterium]
MKSRWFAAILALLLLSAGAAGAELQKGRVKGRVFTSPDGIRFEVPLEFHLASQEHHDLGFFRIVLRSPEYPTNHERAIVIDVEPGPGGVTEGTGEDAATILSQFRLHKDWRFAETAVLSDVVTKGRGFPVRETLIAFRTDQATDRRISYAFGFTFSTEKHLARVFYLCKGMERTLDVEIGKLRELFETLEIP